MTPGADQRTPFWLGIRGDADRKLALFFAFPYLAWLAIPLWDLSKAGASQWPHWLLMILVITVGFFYSIVWLINPLAPAADGIPRRFWVVVSTMTVLTVTTMILGGAAFPGLLFLNSFVASPWALLSPRQFLGPGLLVIIVVTTVEGFIFSVPTSIFVMGLTVTIITGAACWVSRFSIDRQRRLDLERERHHQFQREAERTQINSNLHDVLGQDLTGLALKAELASRLLDAGQVEGAKAELDDVADLSRQALADVREVVANSRIWSVDREIAIASDLLRAANITLIVEQSADLPVEPVAGAFARTIRESITNMLNHSHAERCRIITTLTSVRIENDGFTHRFSKATAGSRHGLVGLQDATKDFGTLTWGNHGNQWYVDFQVS